MPSRVRRPAQATEVEDIIPACVAQTSPNSIVLMKKLTLPDTDKLRGYFSSIEVIFSTTDKLGGYFSSIEVIFSTTDKLR